MVDQEMGHTHLLSTSQVVVLLLYNGNHPLRDDKIRLLQATDGAGLNLLNKLMSSEFYSNFFL